MSGTETVPVARVKPILHNGKRYRDVVMWCPGCELIHRVTIVGENGDLPPFEWTWDGNIDAPTLSPSLLVTRRYGGDGPDGYDVRCHSFVRAGRWEFLSDCSHALAGQTIALPPLPTWALS